MIKDLNHHPFYIWSVHHTEALRVAVMLRHNTDRTKP